MSTFRLDETHRCGIAVGCRGKQNVWGGTSSSNPGTDLTQIHNRYLLHVKTMHWYLL
jgi:hypothetical protein